MTFTIDTTLDIDAPADVVWEVLTDVARYREWNPFCVECSSTLAPGDPIEMKVKLLGKPQRQREWMRDYVKDEGFTYAMKPVPLGTLSSMRSHNVLELSAERTRYRSFFQLQGWLQPVVTTLLGSRLEAGFAGMTAAVGARAHHLWAERNPQTR